MRGFGGGSDSGTRDGAGSGSRRISASGMFAGNLLLALVWMAMSGHFDVANLLLGFAFGFVVLFLLQRVIGRSDYFRRSIVLVRFSSSSNRIVIGLTPSE